MRFTHAIFDFDGTIADSMDLWVNAPSAYLKSKGIAEYGDIDNIARPKGLMQTCICIKDNFLPDMRAEEIFAELCEQIGEKYRHSVPFKQGIEGVLECVQKAGLHMCIATATTASYVQAALCRWGLDGFFDFIITCDEVGAPKNSPLIYIEAAKRMNAVPARTLVFEDSLFAVSAAREAGFFTVGVFDRQCPDRREAMQKTCDLYLPELHEHGSLLRLLQEA